ncbi:MAG: hypothetical protein WHU94_10495 [Thermogemmata sp.]|jgi:hypothetical protein
MKVALFCPVRLEKSALSIALQGIGRAQEAVGKMTCIFYDDNVSADSSAALRRFVEEGENRVVLPKIPDLPESSHSRRKTNRGWTPQTVDRIATIKNAALEVVKGSECDAVFLMDADLICHPCLIDALLECDGEIVSGVFWTEFKEGGPLMPNCWDIQTYRHRSADSIIQLREPGVYEVGGLGAATLVKKKALEAGVNFARIPNLDMWGEDKHFCVRAVCLGFRLYVDTRYPLFHMYRPRDVSEGEQWLRDGCPPEYIRSKLNGEWERRVREAWARSNGAGEMTVRRLLARGLRRVAAWVDEK